jgi:hypothetical protein
MSAIRSNSNRSEARKSRSTPYARGFVRILTGITDMAFVLNEISRLTLFLDFSIILLEHHPNNLKEKTRLTMDE